MFIKKKLKIEVWIKPWVKNHESLVYCNSPNAYTHLAQCKVLCVYVCMCVVAIAKIILTINKKYLYFFFLTHTQTPTRPVNQ